VISSAALPLIVTAVMIEIKKLPVLKPIHSNIKLNFVRFFQNLACAPTVINVDSSMEPMN